jgi:hypothetical protein
MLRQCSIEGSFSPLIGSFIPIFIHSFIHSFAHLCPALSNDNGDDLCLTVTPIYHIHVLLLCVVERAIDMNHVAELREDGNTKQDRPKVWMDKQV